MAISRITTWISGQVLTASALNGDFNNIIDNALSLISPLTANLAAGGFSITGLALGAVGTPSLSFTGDSNTGSYSPAADVYALTAGGVDTMRFSTVASAVNYFSVIPVAAAGVGVRLLADGSDTNVNMHLEGKGTGFVQITDMAYSNTMLIQVFS